MVNFYSSKDLEDSNKIKMGDETHDNARILREERFLISQIGDEKIPCGITNLEELGYGKSAPILRD